jgi:hypothetical protein
MKGMSVTSKPLTERSVDYSTETEFSFSFLCDRCGREWRSVTTAYERAGFTDINCAEAEARIWSEERRTAFEMANLEAMFHFNYCQDCERWVCDSCFSQESFGHEAGCVDCVKTGCRVEEGQS